jgi:hypothetical protein
VLLSVMAVDANATTGGGGGGRGEACLKVIVLNSKEITRNKGRSVQGLSVHAGRGGGH